MSYNPRNIRPGAMGSGPITRPGNFRSGMQQGFVSGGQFQPAPKPLIQPSIRHQQQQQPQQPKQQQQQQIVPLKSALKKTESATPGVEPAQAQMQTQANTAFNATALSSISLPEPMEDVKSEVAPAAPDAVENETAAIEEGKKKTIFFSKGKISKKERRSRRNQRFRKILQPKNALMVLNELYAGRKINVASKNGGVPMKPEMFEASVVIENKEHFGYGKSKADAKMAAAEAALKHIVVNKLLRNLHLMKPVANAPTPATTDDSSVVDNDGDTSMAAAETNESETNGGEGVDNGANVTGEEEDMSWVHIASFAMHKLFNDWDASVENSVANSMAMNATAAAAVAAMAAATAALEPQKKVVCQPGSVKRPAKQLPENPHLMNPVMLVNQMKPDTTYEDVARESKPPYTIFTVKANVDGQDFFGKGTSKKLARINCAYDICNNIFGIVYE